MLASIWTLPQSMKPSFSGASGGRPSGTRGRTGRIRFE